MYKEVVIKAFEKAKKDITGRSNKTNRSEHISHVLLDDFKYQVSGKTLRNHLDKSVNSNSNEDISINSDYVHHLCLYLGFANYNEFLKIYPVVLEDTNEHWLKVFIKKNKSALIISVLTIIVVFSITSFNQQRWMIWDDTHYIEVEFDAEKYSLSQLKIYNQERIENFQRVTPDCKTIFYTEDGTINLWYGKNTSGELQYFTTIAKHPETGKTLKEITDYMIKKYICENY
ncbi:hypothetical protein [Thalassobellus suaedae]|uniref:Uncharacterized protein n=1 Tax=Thalassobellus suaedae TaxID=3074124 RepID=A0ABY9XVC8_9FLAO|nr:hypothetical protein RHP51_04095 [Flavobacteriaceae bacterium HL-DH14]